MARPFRQPRSNRAQRPWLRPTLEMLEDRLAPATLTVTGVGDEIAVDGVVTLREALTAANSNATSGDAPAGESGGVDVIEFAIPRGGPGHVYYKADNGGVANGIVSAANIAIVPAGFSDADLLDPVLMGGAANVADPDWRHSWWSIQPTSALPSIQGQVTIAGDTQPESSANTLAVGNDSVHRIEISGRFAGSTRGLLVAAAGTMIRGLVINGFSGFLSHGIAVAAENATVEGSYIGTDVSGTLDLGNDGDGIAIGNVPNAVIGGVATGARNVISGNGATGVEIGGPYTATGSVVVNNYIGTNAAGLAAIANDSGVSINDGHGNRIGGATEAERNLISGNGRSGVIIYNGHGSFFSATGNSILGNFIGANATGDAAVPNLQGGVVIQGDQAKFNAVGGSDPGAGNVISGNVANGVVVSNFNNVQGNFIGTGKLGLGELGNGGAGVMVAGNVLVGGAAESEANTIAFNGGDGIVLLSGVGASFLGNRIYDNGGLGIDLGADGLAINDEGDIDNGANGLQNYPVLTAARGSVSSGGVFGFRPESITITGALSSRPGQTYRLEFFTNRLPDAGEVAQGRTFLGFTSVTTDAGGGVDIEVTLPSPSFFLSHQVITATATDSQGNTSELSAAIPLFFPPLAVDDQFSMTANTTATFNILDNDGHVYDDPLTTTIISSPHGTAAIVDSKLQFTPLAGFLGSTTVTYEIADPAGLTDTAVATINVVDPVGRSLVDLLRNLLERIQTQLSPAGLLQNDEFIAALDEFETPLTASGLGETLHTALGALTVDFGNLNALLNIDNFTSINVDILPLANAAILERWALGEDFEEPEELLRVEYTFNDVTLLPQDDLTANFGDIVPEGWSGTVALREVTLAGKLTFSIDSADRFYLHTGLADNPPARPSTLQATFDTHVDFDAGSVFPRQVEVHSFSLDLDTIVDFGLRGLGNEELRVYFPSSVDYTEVTINPSINLRDAQFTLDATLGLGFLLDDEGDPAQLTLVASQQVEEVTVNMPQGPQTHEVLVFEFTLDLPAGRLGDFEIRDLHLVRSGPKGAFSMSGKLKLPFDLTPPALGGFAALAVTAEQPEDELPFEGFFSEVAFDLSSFPIPLSGFSLGDFFRFGGGRLVNTLSIDLSRQDHVLAGNLGIEDASGVLIPASGGDGLLSFTDLSATITPFGIDITEGDFTINLFDYLKVELKDVTLDMSPDPTVDDDEEVALAAQTVVVSAPELTQNLTANVNGGIGVTRDGKFRLLGDETQVFLDLSALDKALPLAGVLPFKIKKLGIQFNEPVDLGDGIDPDSLSLLLDIEFKKDAFADLPFEPTIQIGTGDPKTNFVNLELYLPALSGPNPQYFFKDVGPITLGLASKNLAPVTISGKVTLEGFKGGALQPGVSGEFTLGGVGVEGIVEGTEKVTVTGTIDYNPDEQSTLDLLAVFDTSLKIANGLIELEHAKIGLAFRLVNTPTEEEPVHLDGLLSLSTKGDDNLSIGRLTIHFLEALTFVGQNIEVDFGAPQDELIVEFGSLTLEFQQALGHLDGFGGSVHNLGIGRDGTIFLKDDAATPDIPGDGFRFDIHFPDRATLGLPPWLPMNLTSVGVQLLPGFFAEGGNALGELEINDPKKFVLIVGGEVEVGIFRADFEGAKFFPDRLFDAADKPDPMEFPSGGGFHLREQNYGPILLGGTLRLGTTAAGNFYLDIGATFGIEGISGLGGRMIITEKGPIGASLLVPTAIPVGPGLVMTSVTGGLVFAAPPAVESVDDLQPIDVTTLPEALVDLERAVDLAVNENVSLWEKPVTLALGGRIIFLPLPGVVTGDVRFAANTEGTLASVGMIKFFGVPLGDSVALYDFRTPDFKIYGKVSVPSEGTPLGGFFPVHQQVRFTFDSTGMLRGAAKALDILLERILKNTLPMAGSFIAKVFDDVVAGVRNNPVSQLARLLSSDGVSTANISKAQLVRALQRALNGDPAQAFEAVQLILAELLAAAERTSAEAPDRDELPLGEQLFRDLADFLGETSDAAMAVLFNVRDAMKAAGQAFNDEFDARVRFEGEAQPTILGFPFGPPTGQFLFDLDKHGIIITGKMSLTDTFLSLASGGLIDNLPLPEVFNDSTFVTIRLPFGNVLGGELPPEVSAVGGPWELGFSGGFSVFGIQVGQISGYAFPKNSTIIGSRVIRRDANNDGVPDDPQPGFIQVDNDKYGRLEEFGGLILDGRLMLPKILIDPLAVFNEIGAIPVPDPVKQPLEFIDYLTQAASELDDAANVGQLQLYVPNFTTGLFEELARSLGVSVQEAIEQAQEDPRVALRNVLGNLSNAARTALNTLLGNSYFQGDFVGKLLGMNLADAYVKVERGRIVISAASANFYGVPLGFGINFFLDTGAQGHPRLGAEVVFGNPDPDVCPLYFDEPTPTPAEQFSAFLETLGVPADLLSADLGGVVRVFSPGYDPASSDPLLRSGGVEVCADANLWGLLRGHARGRITGEDFLLDFEASSQIDILNVVQLNGSIRVHKQLGSSGNAFEATFEGEVTVLGQTVGASGGITEGGCLFLFVEINGEEHGLYIDLKKALRGEFQDPFDPNNCGDAPLGAVIVTANPTETIIGEPAAGPVVVPLTITSSPIEAGREVSVDYNFAEIGPNPAFRALDFEVRTSEGKQLSAAADASYSVSGSPTGISNTTRLTVVKRSTNNASSSALLRFDVSTLPEPGLIGKAQLVLVVASAPLTTLTLGVFEVKQPWSETNGSSYNRAGAVDTGIRLSIKSAPVGGNGDRVSLILTSLVKKWKANPAANHGIELRVVSGQNDRTVTFHSRSSPSVNARPTLFVSAYTAVAPASGSFVLTSEHPREQFRILIKHDTASELDERFRFTMSLTGSQPNVVLHNDDVPFTIKFDEQELPRDPLVAYRFDGLPSPQAGADDPYQFLLEPTDGVAQSPSAPLPSPGRLTATPLAHTDSVSGNRALAFDGTDAPIIVTAPSQYLTDSFTIEFLAHVDARPQPGATAILLAFDTLKVTLDSLGNLMLQVRSQNQDYNAFLLGKTPAAWLHVALVYTPGRRLFALVDGEQKAVLNNIDPTHLFGETLRLGQGFHGKLDELRFWEHARTSSELHSLRTQTATGREPGLVLYYRFDGADQGMIADLTGRERHAPYETIPLASRPALVASTAPLGYAVATITGPGGLPERSEAFPLGAFSNAASANQWVATSTEPVVYSANLLVNGSAEQALAQGWQGAWRRLTPVLPRPVGGSALFAGPVQTTSGSLGAGTFQFDPLPELVQTVDVTAYAARIDHGGQQFVFNGFVRSRNEEKPTADGARIVVDYLDAGGQLIPGGRFDSGMIRNISEWEQVTDRRVAPALTRFIRIRLISDLGGALPTAGAAADGEFDALSLQAVEATKYFEFTLGQVDYPLPTPGTTNERRVVTLTGLQFWERRDRTQPVFWELRSSRDGFTRSLAVGETHAALTRHVIDLAPHFGGMDLTDEPLTFRLYAIGTQNFGWRIDNLAVLGAVQDAGIIPSAIADVFNVNEGVATPLNVLANDLAEPETRHIYSFTPPAHGMLVRSADQRSFTYTAAAGFSGVDTFTYVLRQGPFLAQPVTVTLNVNGPPSARNDVFPAVFAGAPAVILDVLANDTDPDGDVLHITAVTRPAFGSVSIVSGAARKMLRYVPPANVTANRTVTFRYTISDGHGFNETATVQILVRKRTPRR